MLEILFTYILFVLIPISAVVLFSISLFRYIQAKMQNKKTPGFFSHEEIKKRKTMLIIMSVVAGVLVTVVVGLIGLFMVELAHM